ncbi:MAG: phosphotransferase [Desulfobulbaceae bacterium]|nr:phosphotransferase [Desulfobulbaceae bacterium]
MKAKRNRVVLNACRLLADKRLLNGSCDPSIELLAGDGSQRTFYRLSFADGLRVVAIAPAGSRQQGLAEAHASWNIGRHLFGRGVPVPGHFAFDRETGLILAEDLGDLRLHEYALKTHPGTKKLAAVYTRVIQALVRMQVRGAEGFQASWCWQTPAYDRQLMLERESGYFAAALCRGLLGLDPGSSVLQDEFEDIAAKAAEAPAHFFLHRDFQSRNIMLQEGRVRIIDFQGGRFGPLGYDLASLVLDPYVGLPQALQEQLIEEYLRVLNSHISYDAAVFRREYAYLSLQRNMQVLGAFAFLSTERGKIFFRPYIRLALLSLQSLLAKPLLQKYSALKQLTESCLEKAQQHDI